jgi:hypothetical protein
MKSKTSSRMRHSKNIPESTTTSASIWLNLYVWSRKAALLRLRAEVSSSSRSF